MNPSQNTVKFCYSMVNFLGNNHIQHPILTQVEEGVSMMKSKLICMLYL